MSPTAPQEVAQRQAQFVGERPRACRVEQSSRAPPSTGQLAQEESTCDLAGTADRGEHLRPAEADGPKDGRADHQRRADHHRRGLHHGGVSVQHRPCQHGHRQTPRGERGNHRGGHDGCCDGLRREVPAREHVDARRRSHRTTTQSDAVAGRECCLVGHDSLSQRDAGRACTEKPRSGNDDEDRCRQKREEARRMDLGETVHDVDDHVTLQDAQRGHDRHGEHGWQGTAHATVTVSAVSLFRRDSIAPSV